VLGSLALSAQASVSLTSTSTTYAQNFDTLANSGIQALLTNDSTLPGWSLIKSDGKPGAGYIVSDGTGQFGSFASCRSYGNGTSTDRSLGMIPAANSNWGSPAPAVGSVAGWIALDATNNTGGALGAFTLSCAGEQWSSGGSNVPKTLTVEYGFGSWTAVTNWTAAGAGFNFNTPVQSTSPLSVDGNTTGYMSGLGGTISGGQ